MPWTTLHMQVTSPLFNDGGTKDAGIRPPSLRGLLRFWYRTLAGTVVGSDLNRLAAGEAAVFGDTDNSSPVRIRIPRQPAVQPPGAPDWCNHEDDGRALMYLLGQGLAKPVRPERRPRGRWNYDCTLLRSYVAAGEPFDLQFSYRDGDAATLFLASLWLLTTYGGIGARTHRGWGGVRILGNSGPLPAPWNESSIRTPRLDFYLGRTTLAPDHEPLVEVQPILHRVAGPGSASDVRPSYPTLSRKYTSAAMILAEQPSFAKILVDAGEELRWFRGNVDNPGARYEPAVKTSEWLDTINDRGTSFPIGVLGLPVNYKGENTVRAVDRASRAELRRASPLWLRPVSDGRSWALFTFAFRNTFLPPSVDVELVHQGRPRRSLMVTDDDLDRITELWMHTHRQDGTFIRTYSAASQR